MPRQFSTTLPGGGVCMEEPPRGVIEEISPTMAARTLCETVRDEHGRRGIGAFLAAAAPFLPRELVEETARHFRLEPPATPGPPSEKPPAKEAPSIPPELLLSLLQGAGGGNSLDPMTLLKLLQK